MAKRINGTDRKLSPYRRIRRSLLFNMIILPLIPFVAVILIGGVFFYDAVKNMTIVGMHRVVEDHRHMIESFLEERQTDLEWIIQTYSTEVLSRPEQLENVFQALQKKSIAFADLGFFNRSGMHLAYSGPYELSGRNYRDAFWFQKVLKKGVYISDVFLGYRQEPHFIIAVAKNDAANQWVLRATIDSHFFTDLVESVRIGKTGEAYIVNQKGYFQTERRSGGSLMSLDIEKDHNPGVHPGIQSFIRKSPHGDYLYTTTWLKKNEWLLIARQEKTDAFRTLHSAIYLIIVVAACSGMAIIPLAFYLTDRIIRRMEKKDTERGLLEQQLIGASRLAELGEMAAGFAHEINNPLQIMKSEKALIDTILNDLKQEHERIKSEDFDQLVDSLDQIHIQINRCAKITQAILKFGRQGEPVPQLLSLETFIPEVTAMVEKRAQVEGIEMTQAVDPDLPQVFADPAQIQQVLLNLYNNAIDAILAKGTGGTGKISIQAIKNTNGHVAILITDTGVGIDEADREKIFAPFYTTKPVGKGTGLGLSVCYGIIENMQGTLSVTSEPGVGSTFTIQLPAGR